MCSLLFLSLSFVLCVMGSVYMWHSLYGSWMWWYLSPTIHFNRRFRALSRKTASQHQRSIITLQSGCEVLFWMSIFLSTPNQPLMFVARKPYFDPIWSYNSAWLFCCWCFSFVDDFLRKKNTYIDIGWIPTLYV